MDRVTGRDGRSYPAAQLSQPELNRVRWLAHNLVHRDGHSIRAAQQLMAGRYGLRRSVGSIARDLQLWECLACAPRPPG